MKNFIAAIGLLFFLQSAWAIDIGDAKDQGLVGEANSGYLAAVHTPANAEVRALIVDVNAKRKDHFEETAKKTGATTEQVAYRFYELAVQRTTPGHYYQDANGHWKKK
ncbi:MAG: YdbL family protein [Gammaproteobacteria bacterium]|nr:YdbL family protein [Gammaproteobacteria bacterium]